ncbi:MAG: RIP metalloprotease RseP [Vicinamibacterales bacterium]
MQTLLAFAFVLGVLVFVHELGHFLAAKRIGIKVLKFQLGFNPTILSFKRGDTEYSIGALPLGGYVKMAGENPEDSREGNPEEFLSRTKWERFQVLFMGPFMNLALAYLLTAVVLFQGAQVEVYMDEPVVVGAVADGSAAASAGIRPGDRIVSIGDRPIATWEEFLLLSSSRANRETTLGIVRDGSEQAVTLTVGSTKQGRFEVGDVGILPDVHPHIPTVNPGEPADRAGIKAGDIVLAIDGKRITFRGELRQAIVSRPGQEMTMSVLRNGQPLDIPVTPDRRGETGWLGIGLADQTKEVKPGALEALRMSGEKNIQYAGLIFETVWGLLTRETSPKQLMGPVAIAQLSGESAQLGWIALLSLMASISLNLGLLNLLPIPVLDGGHILIMALEGIARRDFSMRVKEKMLLAGFMVLMALMVTVIYNDLTRISWIERLMPWR